MSRTGTPGQLFGHVSEPAVQLHPQDLARLRLQDGELAYITSKQGLIVMSVQDSNEVSPNQAFLAMHWGEKFLSGRSSTDMRLAGVNTLTTSVYCPSKATAVLYWFP